MITYIKHKIRTFVDLRVEIIKNQHRQNQQISFSYNQISQLFKEESFIPFSSWSISPDVILHILNDITINNRKCIIEFGSGASTFYIAKLLKVLELDAVFYSVESNEKWALELNRQMQIYNLEDYVNIIYAPLISPAEKIRYKNQRLWYDSNILESEFMGLSKIDLVLVDGPFGGASPYSRYSAIPFLQKKLADDFSVYLDDANRSEEEEIAKRWKEQTGCDLEFKGRYAVLKRELMFDTLPFQLVDIKI